MELPGEVSARGYCWRGDDLEALDSQKPLDFGGLSNALQERRYQVSTCDRQDIRYLVRVLLLSFTCLSDRYFFGEFAVLKTFLTSTRSVRGLSLEGILGTFLTSTCTLWTRFYTPQIQVQVEVLPGPGRGTSRSR
jgi:hypothetical protein